MQRMAQYEWYLVLGARIGEPVPAKYALDGNSDIVKKGKDQLKKGTRISIYVFVHLGFSGLIEDTHVHFPCVQIDASIIFVLSFEKNHSLVSFI
jgi:hypothetical protein